MKVDIHMLLVLLTSVMMVGCAHDGPGLKMLEERAEYVDDAPETSELNLASSGALGQEGKFPVREEPRVALVWIHPQRLSNDEHFWGAWLSLRIEDDNWDTKPATLLEQAPPTAKAKNGQFPSRKRKKTR